MTVFLKGCVFFLLDCESKLFSYIFYYVSNTAQYDYLITKFQNYNSIIA